MNRTDIEGMIPHRDPFLWLDEVTQLVTDEDDTHIHCVKHLPEDLDVFRGHYPAFPVMPGVLQLECCFQASAVLISQVMATGSDEVPVISRVSDVQFRKLVRPGDTLEIDVALTERVSKAFYMTGKVTVGGKVSTRCSFVATAAPKPE